MRVSVDFDKGRSPGEPGERLRAKAEAAVRVRPQRAISLAA
jgi:hypothetical protein